MGIPKISKYNFVKSEKGQGLVEYGLLITIIALACVAAMNFIGCRLQESFFMTAIQIPTLR